MRLSWCVVFGVGAWACSAPPAHAVRDPTGELTPAEYCAKVAVLASGVTELRCDCFAQIAGAMRADNPAYYACSASCVQRSDSSDALRACEEREHCAARTSAVSAARTPSADAEIERYCERMQSLDDDPPHLGMSSCVLLASWAKHDSTKAFDCMRGCAQSSSSQTEYHACLRTMSCVATPAR